MGKKKITFLVWIIIVLRMKKLFKFKIICINYSSRDARAFGSLLYFVNKFVDLNMSYLTITVS